MKPLPAHRTARLSRAAALLGASVALSAEPARADVTSWFFAGGGAAAFTPDVTGKWPNGIMLLETGMGSPPTGPLVVGGLFKTVTFFGHGTDLALVVRTATGGFVHGGFGLAIDAGGFERFWGLSSAGGFGAIVLGAPLGIQASAFAQIGTNDVRGYGGIAGIDLLRLTVHRSTSRNYWPNPFQVGAPQAGTPAL